MNERKMPNIDVILNHCIYGMSNFCDGTVNLSFKGLAKVRKKCPMRGKCPVRAAMKKDVNK